MTDSVFFHDSEFGSKWTFVGSCPMPNYEINGYISFGAVHPDVIPHPKVEGAYLMVWTPFPGEEGSPHCEYPCIAQSTDKLNWVKVPGSNIPLVEVGEFFQADPDLLYLSESDSYLLFGQPQDDLCVHRFICSEKNSQGAPTSFGSGRRVFSGGSWGTPNTARSPSIIRNMITGQYVMFYDKFYDRAAPLFAVGRATSNNSIDWAGDSAPTIRIPDGEGGGTIWHPSVRYFDGCWYLAAAGSQRGCYDNADILLWKSEDGINFIPATGAIGAVIPYESLPSERGMEATTGYRCSMLFEGDTLFLWVSYYIGQQPNNFESRIVLFKTELSADGKARLNYAVRDYDQGGKVITGLPRRY